MAAEDRRREGAAAAAATTTSIVSEAGGALSSYSSFLQMENDVLTSALKMSLFSSSSSPSTSPSSSFVPPLVLPELPPIAPPTTSSTAADQTATGTDRAARRTSRRKLRGPPVRREATTTYITTNPADFRLMVQQATGARRVLPDEAAAIVTETYSRRRSESPFFGGAMPPTLDTSAFAMHEGGTSHVEDAAVGRAQPVQTGRS